MADVLVPLKVLIIDTDESLSKNLEALIIPKNGVECVSVVRDYRQATNLIENDEVNCIYVDIFCHEINKGLSFIEDMRDRFRYIPICLFSTQSNLALMRGVPEFWRIRFNHYYKLYKDQKAPEFYVSVEKMLLRMSMYILTRTAKNNLDKFKKVLIEDESSLSSEQRQQFEEVTASIERALDVKPDSLHGFDAFIPGIEKAEIGRIVIQVLEDAKGTIHNTSRVNIGVIILGGIILIAAFICSLFSESLGIKAYTATAFGGLGMAGIITSLITNPMASLGVNAKRIVQLSVAYFSFFCQLSIISDPSQEIASNEKSELIGKETERIMRILETHYGK